jgi:hypothetical protein
VGIIGLSDAAKFEPLKRDVAATLVDVCEPSGMHCQTAVFA